MSSLLGIGVTPEHLSVLQVGLRAVLVYVMAVAAIRLADRRFLARISATDIILGILLGTVLSRVVNGAGPILPSVVGVLVLVALHRLSAYLAYRSEWFAALVQGHPIELFAGGQMKRTAMRRTRISKTDLLQQIREHGSIGSLDQAERVTLERGGQISVVTKE